MSRRSFHAQRHFQPTNLASSYIKSAELSSTDINAFIFVCYDINNYIFLKAVTFEKDIIIIFFLQTHLL